MEIQRESIGFLGYHHSPQGRHLLRPIVPDGTPSELIDGKNLIHQEYVLTTMPGFEKAFSTQLGSSGKRRCMGIFPYVAASGTVYFILCYPDKIYSYQPGDATPTDITGSVSLTGGETDYFDATYFVDATNYVPWIVLTNGKDAMIKWIGTDNCAALGGTPPVAKLLSSFGGHLIGSHVISGGYSYTQREYRSDVLTAETWSGGLSGTVDLRQDAGNIMGSLVFGDIRFVIKENSIAVNRATGYDPPLIYQDEEIPIGSCASRTIIKCWKYDYGFMLGQDLNCYLLRKDGMYDPIADNIVHKLREYSNNNNIKYAFAFYHTELDYIFLAIPTTDNATNYCDVMFGFDFANYLRTGEKIWTPPIELGKYISAASVNKFKKSYSIQDLGDLYGTIGDIPGTIGSLYLASGFSRMLFGDKDGYIYQFDDTKSTFDGTPIAWEAEFKNIILSNGWADNFRLQEYELLLRNSPDDGASANVYLSTNGSDTFGSAQAITVRDSEVPDYDRNNRSVWYDDVAKKFRIKITGTHRISLIGQRFFGTEEGRM